MLENDFITGGIKVGNTPHLDPYDIIGEKKKTKNRLQHF